MTVRVQTEDFDLSAEIAQLRMHTRKVGAVVTFIGTVRDLNEGEHVAEMELEHYPGMTEKALHDIIDQAKSRWDIFDALVIHRVGPMKPLDQIVLVAVTSAHRGEAFDACEFIIDYLKPKHPFGRKNRHRPVRAGSTRACRMTRQWRNGIHPAKPGVHRRWRQRRCLAALGTLALVECTAAHAAARYLSRQSGGRLPDWDGGWFL